MIQILLADDHSIVRSGVRNIILGHFMQARVDEAGDGEELVEMIKQGYYDLVLLDINMPDTDSLSLIAWIHAMHPACKVLVFTSYPARSYGLRSLQSGAHGFLSKSASTEEILRALEMVLAGRRYISAELADIMVGQVQGKVASNPFNQLSAREMEIARMLQQGLALPEIGKQLHLGYTTVVTYKNRIFQKLDIDNVLALARLLQEHGMGE